MLKEARARARAPVPQWWERLTPDTLGELHRSAIQGAGLSTHPKLLEIVERKYTWDGFVRPCLRDHVDPLPRMIRHLREREAALAPRI